MTTHAPRVPFAPLDNPRLQHLANAKNRQNGLSSLKPSAFPGKPSKLASSTIKTTSPPNKRSYEPSIFEDYDSENVDPSTFDSPPKKAKSSDAKPFTFTLTSTKSMPPPSAFPFSTPIKSNISAPRTPMTAPAGRSPKRKIASISKNRRVSAPFSRIDPPFAQRSTSALPFSLDAALSGSLSATPPPQSAGATIQESMPKNWFFEIYEDTPDELAANLMEHSASTLDLSSDDEGGKREEDGRGKENTPPEGYDGPGMVREVAATGERRTRKVEIVRQKVDVGEMDDGERSPLSALETEAFIPDGLDKESHVVVEEGVDVVERKEVVEENKVEEQKDVKSLKKAKRALEEESEVLVWQDDEK
ncbi:unnamed protein product [Zymoseptoria tritici ST99CH_1E4]|uniref:Uncharacterized protein n=1 Tax=Zymoseptoria tritici ST99CH_1E4 TaxID=1276532 RepID=A0A2H1GU38_ZYMTR|nr:unnamed protein product [Zymoseptoria tritici ST99CH_1E4]